jgi:hypothetical protein
METRDVSVGGVLKETAEVLRRHEVTYMKAGLPWLAVGVATLTAAEYALDQGPLAWLAAGFVLAALGMWLMSALPWIIAGTAAAEVEGKPASAAGRRAAYKVAAQVGAMNLLAWVAGGLPAVAAQAYFGAAGPAAGLGSGDAMAARQAARRAQSGRFLTVMGAMTAAHAVFAVFGCAMLAVMIPGLDVGLPDWAFVGGIALIYLMYSAVMAAVQHGLLRALEAARRA